MANPPGSIRVAFVSPGWPAEAMPNGVVSYIATLVPAMRGLGARCHVLTARPLSDELEPFVRPIETGRSLLSRVLGRVDPEGWPHRAFCAALLEQVNRLWTTEGLDLLEVEDSFGWARLLARKCPVPLVVRLHGPWFLNGQANGLPADASFHRRDRWEKQGLLWAGAVTAPSCHVLEETCRHFAIEFPWSQVIPNPVEIPDEPDRWNLQECQPNRIAFVGRFDRHKGGDTMIQAFAQVLKRRPDAHLDFVGPDRGYIDDAGRTWKFDEFLRKNLAEAQRAQVTYHGFLPRAQAAKVRKKALVTVVPSRYETFGLAAAEAMAAGCPLVAAAVGGLAELVTDGQTALTIRPGDSNDLAEKVLNLLDNPHQAARLGERAAREARRRLAPVVVAEQTLDFYHRVIQSSTRQRAARPLASSAKPLNVPQP